MKEFFKKGGAKRISNRVKLKDGLILFEIRRLIDGNRYNKKAEHLLGFFIIVFFY